MIITTRVTNLSDSNLNCKVDEISICPICKHAIKPVQLSGKIYVTNERDHRVSFLYLCRSCYNTFICQYDDVYDNIENSSTMYHCKPNPIIGPINFKSETYDDLITNAFPSFIKIYNEALQAENLNLDEIAGIGYRKALEFLIKDFLISTNPDEKEKIEKAPLGGCVNTYIDNSLLKTAASRAVWLGNDQTHYIQKFTDKDINDLKSLIRLTVHWISMILETEEAATLEPIK